MEGEEGGCVMLKRLLKRSSTNFWRMLCEGCGVCEGCVCVGRDVLIKISMCVVSGVCMCVCVCAVYLC